MSWNSSGSWASRILYRIKNASEDPSKDFSFVTSCIEAAWEDITALQESKKSVSFAELSEHCDTTAFEAALGYGGDTIELGEDPCIGFYKGVYRGKPCYFIDHSRIEYIWVRTD